MRPVDALIIGQGLAGTAVAWELVRREVRFMIVDAAERVTSSRVAAGLITPVVGTRFSVAPNFDTLLERARAAYLAAERCVGASFFRRQPALRLLYTDEEVHRYERRATRLETSGLVQRLATQGSGFRESRRTILMPDAARLDTAAYLACSRNYFLATDSLITADIALDSLKIEGGGVACEALGVTARRVVFCGGYRDQTNPWLPNDVFNSAQGEILTVDIPGLNESRTVHALKSWLCPTAQPDRYLFGATYRHAPYEHNITSGAREQLEARLGRIVVHPFNVVDQRYGIRPISVGRKVIVGRSSVADSVSWLNGLGSKGALLAPYVASGLVDSLLTDQPPDFELVQVHGHD